MGRYDMKKQYIDVNGYWRVIVYYDADYNSFYNVIDDLKKLKVSNYTINKLVDNIFTRKAKGFTVSNRAFKTSIVVFGEHLNKYDYANSIVHEAEHVKQAMLNAYNVADENEAPAYTIGYLVMKMLEFYMDVLCSY